MIIKELPNKSSGQDSVSLLGQDDINSFSKVKTSENIKVTEGSGIVNEDVLNNTRTQELYQSYDTNNHQKEFAYPQKRSITSISKGIADLKLNAIKLSGYISNGDIKMMHAFIDSLENSFNSILDVISDCSNYRVDRDFYKNMMYNSLEGHKKHQNLTNLDVLHPTFEYLSEIVRLSKVAPLEIGKRYSTYSLSKYKLEYKTRLYSIVDSFYNELLYNKDTMCTYIKTDNNTALQFISRDAHYFVDKIYLKAFKSIVASVPKCAIYKKELILLNKQISHLETLKSLSFCNYKNSNNTDHKDFYSKNKLIGKEIMKYNYLNHDFNPNEKDMCYDKNLNDLNKHCTFKVGDWITLKNNSMNSQEKIINGYSTKPSVECWPFALDKDPKQLPFKRPDIFTDLSASNSSASNSFYISLTPIFLIISLLFIFLIKKC